MNPDKNKLKGTQCYQHSAGVVHVEGWNNNKPFLVLTENSYYDSGESWGYTYYKLASIDTKEEAHKKAAEINAKYGLPLFFDDKGSVNLLQTLRQQFPLMEQYFKKESATAAN